MDLVASSTPYLPSHDGLICQLLLLQFVNQLRAHHNTTTVQEVQHCVESLKQEERRQKQLITRHEDEYSKLYADHLTLQNLYLSRGKYIENLEQSLKKYEEKISALEGQVKKETSARMVCECDATLQRALEQMNTELHEMRNCSLSDDANINQTLATLQLVSQNQNIENDIYMLENKLSIANRTIENSTEMYTRQSRELEFERQKTHTLEELNGQLEISLRNVREQNQNFQAELQANAELLNKTDEKLRNQDEEIKKKDTELKNKDNELIYELRRNTQLQNMLVELYKKQIDFKKQDDELLKTEKSNCSTLPQQQITVLESKLKIWENKTQEAQNRLKSCNQQMKPTKEQTRKHIYMVENLLSLTKQTIRMHATQDTTLENQRKKIQDLEKRNAQLEYSMNKLQKQQDEQNKTFEAKLQIKDDQLQLKDEDLKQKNHELKMKDDELQLKDEDLKQKNHELKMKDDQLQLKDEDLKQKNHELKMKDDQLQLKDEDLKQKNHELKMKDNELHKKKKELKEKDEAAEQQTVIARKRITKVIKFTNKYRKYLASGTFNFAIAHHGDTEIKDIFQPLQDMFGGRITEQEVSKEGYNCENGIYIPWCLWCDGIDDCGNQKDERDCNPTVFSEYARVMPGPDWDYAKLGGDSLMLGTVASVADLGEVTEVKWDNGNITEHNITSGGKMELRAVAGYFCNIGYPWYGPIAGYHLSG